MSLREVEEFRNQCILDDYKARLKAREADVSALQNENSRLLAEIEHLSDQLRYEI